MPTAHPAQAVTENAESTNLHLKYDCGLLAGIRYLRHIVLVKLRQPSVFRNGLLFVRANGVSHLPEPADYTSELRCVVQPFGLSYRQSSALLQVGQDISLRIVHLS